MDTHLIKISGKFEKGDVPWNKGKKRPEISGDKHWNWKGVTKNKNCLFCGILFKTRSKKVKTCSTSCGNKLRFVKKENHPRFGKKHTAEAKTKMRNARLVNPTRYWLRGTGVTPINEKLRKNDAYRQWRKSVFERDDYTCVDCNAKSCKGTKVFLHADHIKPFAYFPELRLEISNGRTLCVQCHRKTDTWGYRAVKKHE